MQKIKTLALLLAALMVVACSGGNNNQIVGNQPIGGVPPKMSAVAGSSLVGISYSCSPDKLVVNFDSIQGDGQYVEFQLPTGIAPVSQSWAGNEGTISLMLHAEGIVQVGVAPLAGYQGNPVTLTAQLGRRLRHLSKAPTGEKNQLIDLAIENQGDGTSKLEWSEVNVGDYDFNSEVNVADLTPIALNFHQSGFERTPNNTQFWVDGDRNGEVNLADITPIAINFQNNINSYRVVSPGGTEVIALRTESIDRDGLPPKYSVVIPGNPFESWQVAPIDTGGEAGLVTETETHDTDLLLDVNITGMALYSLDGSGNFGLAADGRLKSYLVELEPLRRIMPGEDPAIAEIGTTVDQTTPSLKLYEMPRDSYLALVVLFIPTIDLVTGLPRDLGAAPGLDIWEYDPAVTIVPFKLAGIDANSHAMVEIDLAPGEFDGFRADITTSGFGLHPGWVDLDYGDGILVRDSNGNLIHEDDARMFDENRWGITISRLEQLAQLDEYANGVNTPFVLTAFVNSFDQGIGEMSLKETMVHFDGQDPPVDMGEIPLVFSEYATFASRLFGEEEESPIDPGIIEFGIEIEIQGYRLEDDLGGLEAVYWGEHIVKIIR